MEIHIKLAFKRNHFKEANKMISKEKIESCLKTKILGRKIHYYQVLSSTNKLAKNLALHGASEGTLVIAEKQTEGKGRLNRKWFSPNGGLWFSIILKPKIKTFEASKLTFPISLAIAETIRKTFNLNVEIKWPNDILINNRKVCGILTESVTKEKKLKFVVVGIGLNVNINLKEFPENLRCSATTLKEELKRNVKLEHLLCELLFQIEREYELFLNEDFRKILERWKSFASFLGKRIKILMNGKLYEGIAEDVDNEGKLVVKFLDGTVRNFVAGELKYNFI
ncbi:biotin--[acetyl-CoA-carboxylase] ligase [Candidatus Bathyarchaeota archaeon]|nr:MAG: biotin--[acetyl-CoA-carboxylase] ligase [Candidatus Bathyarchaeota archaeon]